MFLQSADADARRNQYLKQIVGHSGEVVIAIGGADEDQTVVLIDVSLQSCVAGNIQLVQQLGRNLDLVRKSSSHCRRRSRRRSLEKSHLTRFAFGAFPEVVVADKQLRELAVGVVSLLDVVDAGGGQELNSGRIVQLPDEFVIVIREQELALYLHQRIPEPDMVFSVKPSSPTFL
jgi:hypothetical protein